MVVDVYNLLIVDINCGRVNILFRFIICCLSTEREIIHKQHDPTLSILLCWLAVMIFNQMSNSTGLWYTGQPLNLCFNWMECVCVRIHKQTKWDTHRGLRTHNTVYAPVLSFWINTFDIRNTIPPIATVCVCVCLGWEVRKKVGKSSLERLVHVSFIHCGIYTGNNSQFSKTPLPFQK